MKYTDLDIPAKLFFKVIETNDYSLLGHSTEAENKQAFEQIFDEYHEITNSGRVKNDIELRKQIALINYKIEILEITLHILLNFPMKESQRLEIIENLKSIEVKIEPSENMVEQIERIAQTKLGSLKTKLNILIDRYEKQSNKKEVKNTFEKLIVNIENVLNRSIDENISMRKYLALQESCNEKIKQSKK